jgi:hypothetical protein
MPDSNGERPLGLRNGVVLRGTAIGTKASAGDADVYQHANGPPSHLARIACDRRGSEEQSRRDLEAQASWVRGFRKELRFTFAPLLWPARFPCLVGPP